MAENRELDVIIFGASGFTGKYTIFEGIKLLADYKWGIAGRNKSKLEAVLKEIGEKVEKDLSNIPIINADVDDPASLKAMAEKCKVVLNCTGPYRLWGEQVVKACIEAGTHQVDVSGEPQYIERMAQQYNEKAKEKGSYIVSACGFDSIPVDMGLVYLDRHFEGTVNSVETYHDVGDASGAKGAVLHYGTWASLVYGISHWNELKALRKESKKTPSMTPKLQPRQRVHKSKELGTWCVPFPAADASIAYRSQNYFYEAEGARPIQVKTYLSLGSIVATAAMAVFSVIFMIMCQFSFGQYLLLTYPQYFSFGKCTHEGPSEETMKKSKFTVHLFGKGWSEKLSKPTEASSNPPNKSIHVRVSGTNPGYGFTCVGLILCGLALIKEKSKLPQNGGVYSTAAAFAKTNLVEDLCKNGATFEVVSANETSKKDE